MPKQAAALLACLCFCSHHIGCCTSRSLWLLRAAAAAAAAAAGAISSLQTSFDGCVSAARASQLQLLVDLKADEGRLLMMLKELGLLKVGVHGLMEVLIWGWN
jgi:hypothetical protein